MHFVFTRFTGASEEEARVALKAFAKFHANGMEVARKIGWDKFDTPENKYSSALHSNPIDSELMREVNNND
jgi:hypothetical protein